MLSVGEHKANLRRECAASLGGDKTTVVNERFVASRLALCVVRGSKKLCPWWTGVGFKLATHVATVSRRRSDSDGNGEVGVCVLIEADVRR